MAVFTIQTPSGKTLDIEAGDEAAAIRGAKEWEATNTSGFSSFDQPQNTPSIAAPEEPVSSAQHLGRMVTDIPSEIYQAGKSAVSAMNEAFNPYSETAQAEMQRRKNLGLFEGLGETVKSGLNIGSGVLGLPSLVGAPATGASRSVIGHALSAAPGGGSYEESKDKADIAMMGIRPAIPGPVTAQALAQRAAAKTAAKGVTTSQLETAATPVYEGLTQRGNTIVLPKGVGKQMADDIETILHPQSLRPGSAERTFGHLKLLDKVEDLNDVAIIRDKLRDTANGIANDRIAIVKGRDAEAARRSMKMLDQEMDRLSPGWTADMAEADSNWAAMRRMKSVQKEAEKGKKGRLGSFDSKESRAKGFTKEELEAVKRADTGGALGTALNAVGAGLNPFHGGIGPVISAAAHGAATLPTAGLNWLAYAAGVPVGMAADKGARLLRQRALDKALSQISRRSPLGQQITAPPTPLLGPFNSLNRGSTGALLGMYPYYPASEEDQ
jgi:hypothetical protein